MVQTPDPARSIRQKDDTIYKKIGENEGRTKKRRQNHHPLKTNSEIISQPPPNIIITPATPGTETPPRKPSILPASVIPSRFTEWRTSTRQGTFIHFTPRTDTASTASTNSLTKYTMQTPRNFLDRLRRDHTLFLGSSVEGPELGFTRELPHGYLFTVGNPAVLGKKKPQFLRWPCENEIPKRSGQEVRWEFKADLSTYGPGRQWVWVRTKGLGRGSGINEMELRDSDGRVAAIWRRGGSAFRGQLWIRNGKTRYGTDDHLKIVRMRWEIAVLLTWRLVLDRSIKEGDFRASW